MKKTKFTETQIVKAIKEAERAHDNKLLEDVLSKKYLSLRPVVIELITS